MVCNYFLFLIIFYFSLSYFESLFSIIIIIIIIEDVLDPCNSGIAEGTSDKKYRIRTHAKEIPHVSYASTLSCQTLKHNNENENNDTPEDWRVIRLNDVKKACSRLYEPHLRVHDKLATGNFDDLDNDSYRAWMDCTQ